MGNFIIPANYYQQFDADYNLDVPAEGFGGWKKSNIELSEEHTALVVMHAWDLSSYQQDSAVCRRYEFLPRANKIIKEIFPRIIPLVRKSSMKIYHVVGGGEHYYKKYSGYGRALNLLEREKAKYPTIEKLSDIPAMANEPVWMKLNEFKAKSWQGTHNMKDLGNALTNMADFPEEAKPHDNEGIAENENQLFALCKADNVNHLIYIGFAINVCLMFSPGGMCDMRRRGFLCSTIREAVTAAENKETAREERCKEVAMWNFATSGFIFDLDDFCAALNEKTLR